ncbi:MAG: tetratricopeptide repeat protein [Spirulinaceae cyanobacterium]
MSKRKIRSPWLYGGVIVLLVILVGAYTLPLVTEVVRNRPANSLPNTVVASNSPTPVPSPQTQESLRKQTEGWELVLEREPNNLTALQGLVEARLQQGQIREAMLPLARLAQLTPEQPDYAILLGQAYEHFGELDQALAAYETVLQTHPGYIKALQSIVALKLQQGSPEWAIGLLEATLQTSAQANEAAPGSIDVASVQMLLGRVYEYQERYTEAIAVYDQVIAQNKLDFRPLWAKADILRQQNQRNGALTLYDRALTLAPPRYKDQIKQLMANLDQPLPEAASTPPPTALPEAVSPPLPAPDAEELDAEELESDELEPAATAAGEFTIETGKVGESGLRVEEN